MPSNNKRSIANADADPRRAAGLRLLRIIGGPDHANTTSLLARLSPDFVDLLIATGYGELLSRPALNMKTRELVTVAVLAARGNTPSAFRFHCGGMLNTGWTPVQVVETIRLASSHTGIANASANLARVGEVFASRGMAVTENGRQHSDTGHIGVPVTAPAMAGELNEKMRHIASLAILVAIGAEDAEVSRQVNACQRGGWTREEIVEVLIQLTGYIGWPMALASAASVLSALDHANDIDIAAHIEAPTPMPGDESDGRRFLRRYGSAAAPVLQDADRVAAGWERDGAAAIWQARQGIDATRVNADLCIIAALTALGRPADADFLRLHIAAALDAGTPPATIISLVESLSPYVGWPAVRRAGAIVAAELASPASLSAPGRERHHE
jgi:4-carboxymuconolactone decarboxylase